MAVYMQIREIQIRARRSTVRHWLCLAEPQWLTVIVNTLSRVFEHKYYAMAKWVNLNV